MPSKLQKLVIEYRFEYYQENGMQLYRNVSIYPKILQKKSAKQFNKAEKEHFTRKGFRWYVYYSFQEPGSEKFV